MRFFTRYSFDKCNHKLAIFVSVFCLALIGANSGSAQNSSNSNTAPTPGPSIIPLYSTISESDKALTKTREVEAFLAEQSLPSAIIEGIPATKAEIAELNATTSALLTGQVTLEAITAAESEWRAIRGKLDRWESSLKDQTTAIDNRIADLRSLREQWTASRSAITGTAEANTAQDAADVIPEELIRRADNTLGAIAQAEKAAGEQRAEFFALESQISELQTEVNSVLADLKSNREQQLVNIFRQSDNPLWSAEWSELEVRNLAPAIGMSLANQGQELRNYASRSPYRFAWHAVLLVGLATFLFWARRRIVPIVEKEPKLARPAAFFKLPIASALVVSVFFVTFLYPQAPRLLLTIIGAAAIIPGILILRRIIESPLTYLLYGLLVLYLLDRVRGVFSDLTLLSRLIFSFEMLTACAFLLWFFWSKRVANNVETGAYSVFQLIRRITPFAVSIFAAALLANLLGFVSISYLVGNGLLRAAYLAVFFYTAVQIFVSAIAFALRVKPFSAARAVRNNRVLVRQRATQIIKWLAVILWIVGVLNLFSIQDYVYSTIGSLIGFQISIGELSVTLGGILLFVVMVWAAVLISRFVRFVLEEDVYPRVEIGSGVSFAISSVVHYLLLIIGFLIAIAAAGVELSRFAVIAGAIGIGLGFGLQNIVNNFVSGLILLFERPVKVGDTVQIGEHMGSLKSIGLRASIVRKVDGADVIVPNSQLISEEVINWTMSDEKRRIDIPVGVAYGTDPARVLDLLSKVPLGKETVLTDPGPRALFIGMGESSLDFELRVWTADPEAWVGLRSELVTDTYNALTEANIEIPFPQRDLNLRNIGDRSAESLAEQLVSSGHEKKS